MTRQWSSRPRHRLLGRAGVLLGVALPLVLHAGPAARADDGLLGDTGPVVEAPVEQVVEVVAPAVPEPVEQPVAPVQPAVQPVGQAAAPVQHTAEQVRHPSQPAGQPVVRTVEQATAPVVTPVEQAATPAPAPAPTHAPAPAPQVSAAGVASDRAGAGVSTARRAGRPSAGTSRRARVERQTSTARSAHPVDLAPHVAGGAGLTDHHARHDQGSDGDREDLVATTEALMDLYAGPGVPGGVSAGLPGSVAGSRTLPWAAPLLLGVLLGLRALVVARRGRVGAGRAGADDPGAITAGLPRR